MPARTRKIFHDELTKEKIRASAIINRLREHALGNNRMTATQIRAAEILLRKVVPDLASVEYTGELTTHNVVSPEPPTPEVWNERFVKPVAH